MAFEGLSEKLQNAFRNLRGKGKLSEADVKEALKEVKVALLEADVNFKVVKNFVKTVEEKCVGEEVLNGLNPSQTVIKVVNDELTSLMGSETTEVAFRPGKEITVIMMVGLQGAGKTTASAKMAGQFIKKGKKSLLVACDIYRPAAIEQLKVNGSKVGVDVFEMGTDVKPPVIAENALEKAKKENYNVVILDTAGRLQIDEVLMNELKEIKEKVGVFQTILVVDAMTGQNAVNVAKTFDEEIGIDGVILSKLDGDTRGGAALSINAVTGKPILYVGMGEKLTDLEQFYPDRMASRILGMGDVLSLIEKAQANVTTTEEESRGMMNRMQKGKFDFNDYLESMKQMKNMGGIASILSMLPGMGVNAADLEGAIDEKKLRQTEAIILSMTPEERSNPKLMNPRRKFRIAKGAGLDIAEVNRFIKQFEQSQKMMKQMGGMGKRGRGMFPGMGGMGGFGGRKGFPFK
ncbi:MAG: signal recognition particle protein [Lachnospiraceae bacterium]|nr:signal recognition particle protein [Lachnospiraceae bacterium]